MKKFLTAFILVSIVFSVLYPTLYATENVLTNEIPEEKTAEVEIMEEQEEIEEQETEKEAPEENEPEEKVEAENVIEEPEIQTPEKNVEPEPPLNIVDTSINEEVKTTTENYTGKMYIDTPSNQTVYTLPDTNQVVFTGWAASNDPDSIIKFYVNTSYWTNITRTEVRGDVNAAYPGYASATQKAGFTHSIDISNFPEGTFTIKFEQVSKYGQVLSSASVNFKVKAREYTGKMYIDTPSNQTVYTLPDTNQVVFNGWAASDDPDSIIKFYVNTSYWTNITRTEVRGDVNAAYPGYANATQKAGFTHSIDISNFPEGTFTIKFEQVSKYGQVLSSASVNFKVKAREYTGKMYIDTPSNQTNYLLPDTNQVVFNGWATSDDPDSILKFYVNTSYWTNITRTEIRGDVNAAYPGYANATQKAGFTHSIDISNFPEGIFTIKIEQVSKYGQVLSSASVNIKVSQKEYIGKINVESLPSLGYNLPDSHTMNLFGWAVANDTGAYVMVKIDGTPMASSVVRTSRKDVDTIISPAYGGTSVTPNAGFSADVDISNLLEGEHSVEILLMSRYHKVLSSDTRHLVIRTPQYTGKINLESPIRNKRYRNGSIDINGWAITDYDGDFIKVYLDGYYQTVAEKTTRRDVLAAYGSSYPNHSEYVGFYSRVDASGLPEGMHTIKVEHYSKYGKKIQEAEVKFMISNTQTWGIDVSHHNGTINWDAVRNSGVNFAILKIGEYRESSGTILMDDHFEEYYQACKARGIAVGGYFYSYAFNPTEAAHEADACTAIIKGKTFEMPIFFDIEDKIVTNAINNGSTNVQNVTNAAITFCDILNTRGYQSGIYSYRNFLYSCLNMSALERYNVWLAHYVTNTDYTGKYDIWQYTSSGKVPGISGNVDLNWCFKRYY